MMIPGSAQEISLWFTILLLGVLVKSSTRAPVQQVNPATTPRDQLVHHGAKFSTLGGGFRYYVLFLTFPWDD